MTSKEQAQKALNKIVKSCCPNCHDDNGCLSCSIEKSCNAQAKYWVDTLQKIIDQQFNPTFEECIKQWEEKGFKVDVWGKETIIIYNYQSVKKEEDEIEITISLDKKTIFYINDPVLSFELNNLIHKTLKAWENNNETK